jgi:predicted ArsR family transcriptional regulator
MHRNKLPEDVLRFIERRIDTVPHLEALLLLWEDPRVSWTEVEIAARVYVSRDRAQAVLQDLAHHDLITVSSQSADRYVYNTGWDESELMKKVASTYRSHLVDLARIIHTKSASEAVREFARAFKLKSEE